MESNAREDMQVEEGENDVELSLCKTQIQNKEGDNIDEIFDKYKITYDEYEKDPIKILSNPNLMARVDNKILDWKVAIPLIISLLAFSKVLI